MQPRDYRGPSLDEMFRQLQQYGYTVQPSNPIRDQREMVLAAFVDFHRSRTYHDRVVYLTEYFALSWGSIRDITRDGLIRVQKDGQKSAPTWATSMRKAGAEGQVLAININRSENETSELPPNNPEMYRITLDKGDESAHMKMYLQLVTMLGPVTDDLVAAGIIPKTFDSNMRKVDLTILSEADAKPKE